MCQHPAYRVVLSPSNPNLCEKPENNSYTTTAPRNCTLLMVRHSSDLSDTSSSWQGNSASMELDHSMSMSQLTLPAIGESQNGRSSGGRARQYQQQHDGGVPLLQNSPYGEMVGRKWPSKKERRQKLTAKQKVSGCGNRQNQNCQI